MAEQDNPADADLQLKKRARRRLVGAIALALFAVIMLPMVMDREPRPANPDIQVRIPSQDSGSLAAKVLPGKPAATPLPAPEPRPVAEPVPGTKPSAETPAAPVASVAAAKPAVDAPPVPAPKAPERPANVAEKPVTKSADKPAAKPADKPAAKPAVDATLPAPSGGQWVVQLGAYKEAGNVKLLLSKLKGVNVPAYTEKYESSQGTRTRVRAGPFATQEAAEKARARIKIIGVDGPVAPK